MFINNLDSVVNMRKLIYIMLVTVLLSSVYALPYEDCNVYGTCRPTPTVSTTGGGSSSNSSFNQSFADATYWRLDGSNDPPSGNWDMGLKNFTGTSYMEVVTLNVTNDLRINGVAINNRFSQPGPITNVRSTGFAVGGRVFNNFSTFVLTGSNTCFANNSWCNGTDINFNNRADTGDLVAILSVPTAAMGGATAYSYVSTVIGYNSILNETAFRSTMIGDTLPQLYNWTTTRIGSGITYMDFMNNTAVALYGNMNATGRICDSVGCIGASVAGGVSNLTNWSEYPAVSDLDMNGYSIGNVDSIVGNTVATADGSFDRVTVSNLTFDMMALQNCSSNTQKLETDASGLVYCDNFTASGGSFSNVNVAYKNSSELITGNWTFNGTSVTIATDKRLKIGNDGGVADILSIYSDPISGRVIFDDSEFFFFGSMQINPDTDFQSRINVAQNANVYSKFGSGTVTAVTPSDNTDRLVSTKNPTTVNAANRAGVFTCEVNGNGSSIAGSCMGINAFAAIPSGYVWNSTVTAQGGSLRGSRNNIVLAGKSNVLKASAFTGIGTVSGKGSSLINFQVFNAEAPSISASTSVTNYTAFNVEGAAVSGTLTNHIGVRIGTLSSSAVNRYGIIQEGGTDKNIFNSNLTVNNFVKATNYTAYDDSIGIDGSVNVTKSVDFLGVVATYCQMTFKGGLMTAENC